jgi:hypothetical protein
LKKPLFQRKKLVGGIIYRSCQHGPLALNSLLYPLLRLWDLKAPEFKPSGVQVKLVPALCHWDSLGVFAENLSVKSDAVPKQKRKKVVAPPPHDHNYNASFIETTCSWTECSPTYQWFIYFCRIFTTGRPEKKRAWGIEQRDFRILKKTIGISWPEKLRCR